METPSASQEVRLPDLSSPTRPGGASPCPLLLLPTSIPSTERDWEASSTPILPLSPALLSVKSFAIYYDPCQQSLCYLMCSVQIQWIEDYRTSACFHFPSVKWGRGHLLWPVNWWDVFWRVFGPWLLCVQCLLHASELWVLFNPRLSGHLAPDPCQVRTLASDFCHLGRHCNGIAITFCDEGLSAGSRDHRRTNNKWLLCCFLLALLWSSITEYLIINSAVCLWS